MSTIRDKTHHVLGRVWTGLKRGAEIGAVVGALFGIGTLLFGAAPFTIPALIGYGLSGAIAGSLFGMNTGGFIGGLSGLLSRPKPNGEALIAKAETCGEGLRKPQQPQQAVPAPAPQQPQHIPSSQYPTAGQQEPAAPAAGVCVKNNAVLEELDAMTAALNESRGTRCPAQGASSWEARMQQGQELAVGARQR